MYKEESLEFDCNMTPWIHQGGLVHKELEVQIWKTKDKPTSENTKIIDKISGDLPTKICEVNFCNGKVLPPRSVPKKEDKNIVATDNLKEQMLDVSPLETSISGLVCVDYNFG